MQQNAIAMTNSTENKQKRTTLLLLILLALSVIGNLFQMRNQSNTVETHEIKIDSMIEVRVELEKELSSVEMELEKYRGISSSLDSMLNDANEQLANQEQKIRLLIANEKDAKKLNAKLKTELAELKRSRDEYLERIDQLITENNLLKAQNESLNASVNNLTDEKRSLQQKVNTASTLQAEYLQIGTFKKKGSGKFIETSIAKRTNKIEVCFTVLENKIAKPGDRTAYAVITEPNGKILAAYTKTEFSTADGQTLAATASQVLSYKNEKANMCLNFENDTRILTPGTYNVEIYLDGVVVANSAFALK
jgi:cell division septum initiation protein DivIVA